MKHSLFKTLVLSISFITMNACSHTNADTLKTNNPSPTTAQANTNKSLNKVWEVQGFKMPESVVYDSARDQYYVSNVNKEPLKQDFNGSIGLIKNPGTNTEEVIVEWVTGLSSPKGLALKGNMLYAADVKELVIIDVSKGKINQRIIAPDTMVLNGIAISDDAIYVSDWMGNAIYKVAGDRLELWIKSDELDLPNGLSVNNDHLYVGTWGTQVQADFSTKTSGSLKRINLSTKQIETLSHEETWMNLDGVQVLDNNNVLITDFIKGEFIEFDAQGKIVNTIQVGKTAAD